MRRHINRSAPLDFRGATPKHLSIIINHFPIHSIPFPHALEAHGNLSSPAPSQLFRSSLASGLLLAINHLSPAIITFLRLQTHLMDYS